MKTKLVYISGGDDFAPTEIKAALDDIRKNLSLPGDVVLFGLPVDNLAEERVKAEIAKAAEVAPPPAAKERDKPGKVVPFPRKKPILNVIGQATAAKTADDDLLAPPTPGESDEDGGDADITKLLDTIGPMSEPPPKAQAKLATEFVGWLAEDDEPKAAAPKKARPFGKRRLPFGIGDLFEYAGIAANDDPGFTLPSFIKRP